MATKAETKYQRSLIKEIEHLIPGCVVLKNNPAEIQGIPDLLVLYRSFWAMLEVKDHLESPFQPNQEFYIGMFNDMSYSAMICPQNEEVVLDELQSAFGINR